jgi:hypothetical protein
MSSPGCLDSGTGSLEAEIASIVRYSTQYMAEYQNATEQRKSVLLQLIIASHKSFNKLLDEKNSGATGGNLFQSYVM